ncbi:hypothetical protein I552_6526 [Mycobacterium xenopi 3993]|nr:hypothetical protein I552_6526 [Mycobacterium xenopi 3993]
MCWMCDHPGSTMQEYLAEVRKTMLRHGWAVQYVEDARVPYAYTVGLTRHDVPELLVTGVPPQRAVRLLNLVGERSVREGPPAPGVQIEIRPGPLLEVVEVEHPDAHMNCAAAIFGNELRALQLVWADRRGRWPWVPGSTMVAAASRCLVRGPYRADLRSGHVLLTAAPNACCLCTPAGARRHGSGGGRYPE